MATATFQAFVDKENCQSSVPSKLRTNNSQRQSIVGKSFQNSQSQIFTPRKALANVNGVDVGKRKALASLDNKIKQVDSKIPVAKKAESGLRLSLSAPAAKPQRPTKERCREKQQLKESELAQGGTISILKARVSLQDEIEHMPPPPEDDDFDDVWPKSERPSSYFEELKNWRPTHIFPIWSTADEDIDNECHVEELDSDFTIFKRKIGDETLEEPDMIHWEEQGGFPLLAELLLPDIPLPTLDDLGLQDSTDLYLDL